MLVQVQPSLPPPVVSPKPVDNHRKKFLGRAMKIELIQETVAEFYGITRADMLCDKRSPKFSRPRHVAYWLAREKAAAMKHNPAFNPYSYPSLGHRFNRDHTTIIAGVEKIARLLETDEKLSTDIAAIREKLAMD
jgi:chromosomal replication initiator protein